ncbi:MAG: prepilin peptidase [Deltaproteobacteria bacterium]|nr:prepilin peptidase [Deltaproteobacteria bacterium]
MLLVLGTFAGSFLNVVIHRLPRGESIVRPRSRCPACGQTIRWYDNVPLLSFVLLGARCRRCQGRISWRYPLVELLCGLLWAALFLRFGPGKAFAVHLVFCSALLAVCFIDIDFRIIPNEISLPGIALGLGGSFLWYEQGFHWESILGLLVGGGGLLLVSLLYALLRGREGMGMGDVKLLGMLGAWLGWKSLLFIVLFASIQGVLVTLGMVVGGVQLKPPLPEEGEEPEQELASQMSGQAEAGPQGVPFMAAAIPFGPFLALAAVEYLFLGPWFYGLLRGA